LRCNLFDPDTFEERVGGGGYVFDPAGGGVGSAGNFQGLDGDEDVAVGGEAFEAEGGGGEDADDDDSVEVALGAVDAGDRIVEQDLWAVWEALQREFAVGGGLDQAGLEDGLLGGHRLAEVLR
jgi:hypothetical protein